MHIEHTEISIIHCVTSNEIQCYVGTTYNDNSYAVYTHSCKLVHTIRAFLYCRHVNFHKTGITFSSRIIVLVLIKCDCVQTKQQTTHHR